VDNAGYAQTLRTVYHRTPALQPLYPRLDSKAPKKVKKMKVVWTADGPVLFWRAPRGKDEMQKARSYVVYAFGPGEKVNTDNPEKIVAITTEPFVKLNYMGGQTRWTFVVTALDRVGNESKANTKKVKL
ncbi:MAG: hypothetical protein K2G61_01875, partial [Bacteroidaceae bacterium]|nr:hypothetical protein [Bacteroidaceae bacterium]